MQTGASAAANRSLRSLLVISFHYPPDGAVGGLRWAGMSKYLARLGWEVHLVTASRGASNTSIPGVVTRVRWRRRTLNDVYNDAAARIRTQDSRSTPTAAEGKAEAKSAEPARWSVRMLARAGLRLGGAWLMFPDYARGWVLRAARAARAMLRARHYDLVITSGPPHSVHLAGALATMGRREPLWIDMRDPWAMEPHQDEPGDWRAGAFGNLIPVLERMVFRRAKRIIVNTAEFAEYLQRTQPQLSVSYVPNGIDTEQLPVRGDARFDGCSIAYVGTLYAGRSLNAVLCAMRAIISSQPELSQSFKLRIAGHLNPTHKQELLAELARGGLDGHVEHLGVVPRAEALDLLTRSNLALVLAQDQKAQVPAKLYECVGLGVPTLVIAERESASAREAQRVGAISVEVDDVDGIRRVFEDALARRLPDRITARSSISYEDLAVELDTLFRSQLPTLQQTER